MTTPLPRKSELVAEWIRRVVTVTDEVSYFGANSVEYAIASSTADLNLETYNLHRQLIRRQTLLAAAGDDLTEVASEHSVTRLGPMYAQMYVILQPQKATVTAITTGKIEVSATDAALFEVGDSLRLTLADGSLSEIVQIQAITAGTGPNGGTELNVGIILNAYNPVTQLVRVLLRKTLPARTVFASSAGITFESLVEVTVGDANPAMAGESTSLALADKVLVEAVQPGVIGNVDALTLSLQTPDADIRTVVNPVRADGGSETESDLSLKYRTAHLHQLLAADTPAMLEALATRGNSDVLRAVAEQSDGLATLRLRVLSRAGGGLATDARAALATYMQSRLRSSLAVEVLNLEVTAIEVTAEVTLVPSTGTNTERLARAWGQVADGLATLLDFRRWRFGEDVDSADLLAVVNGAADVATVAVSSFTPNTTVVVAAASLPRLVRLTLTDTATNLTFGAALATSYA